jgi:hypothetical protein
MIEQIAGKFLMLREGSEKEASEKFSFQANHTKNATTTTWADFRFSLFAQCFFARYNFTHAGPSRKLFGAIARQMLPKIAPQVK